MPNHNVPKWVNELLPNFGPVKEMVLDGDMFSLKGPDGQLQPLSKDIVEAYHKVIEVS